jgi:hypothetical protein
VTFGFIPARFSWRMAALYLGATFGSIYPFGWQGACLAAPAFRFLVFPPAAQSLQPALFALFAAASAEAG